MIFSLDKMTTLNSFDNIKFGKYWTQGVNLVSGCSYVNRACKNCWSFQMIQRFNSNSELINKFMWNGKIIINQHFLKRLKKPNQIFAIWNDLFHHDVPDHFIVDAFNTMATSDSIFLVCTKRVRRLLDLENQLNPTKNVIVGTTCFNTDDISQLFNLLNVSMIKRFKFFISFEPFVGTAFAKPEFHTNPEFAIVGHESGKNAELSILDNTHYLLNHLKSMSIPVFTKQLYINNKLLKHGALPTELKLLYE